MTLGVDRKVRLLRVSITQRRCRHCLGVLLRLNVKIVPGSLGAIRTISATGRQQIRDDDTGNDNSLKQCRTDARPLCVSRDGVPACSR